MAELTGDAATRAAGGPGLPRELPSAPVRGLRAHEGRRGVPRLRGAALIGEVERSGLTGRGGAAYPTGKKLRSVRERAGLRGAVVIANGMESELASAKDAALLARAPHLVLDGIALAAEATSARAAYLCVRRQAQADALAAIAERDGYDPVPVQLALVPGRYVSSAESSLVRYFNGGPALPGFRATRLRRRRPHPPVGTVPRRRRPPGVRAAVRASRGRDGRGLVGAPVSKRLRVNPILCEAHGVCAELLPELIRLDPWGYPILAPSPVPPGLQALARRTVASCPALALLLEPSPAAADGTS